MKIEENISLKKYNTFGIEAKARFFIQVNTVIELVEVLKLPGFPKKLILGGGSNLLFTRDIDALVILIKLKGIDIVEEDKSHIQIRVMAGENWHNFVLWTVNKGYGGLENLSLIPGNTGTAPIQNIGAYGVELKDCFVKCEVIDINTQERYTYDHKACDFGYRNSIFKSKEKGRFIITSVDFRLSKNPRQLNTSYGAIESELALKGIKKPTIKDVSDAVISIRRQKLPDPSELGNSGSFFKNPEINKKQFQLFHKTNPQAPYYQISEDLFKIPAGWLIEQCGFKGKRFGDAGVHKNQALVLVNYGEASGIEILNLAERIQRAVSKQYGITIIPEVNIIG
ncbi:UDP-N-acetylmuramate dehydrogenase [Eudoraea sp.]|uniref:UDP-N-acetylmuramate dehydrogenase n=1 Tax=Eudoraea sp. TaxID=1979955 RepID=UPI003C714CD1